MKNNSEQTFFSVVSAEHQPLKVLLEVSEEEINDMRSELLKQDGSLLTALRNEENWIQMPQTQIIFSAEKHTLNNLLSGTFGYRQNLEMRLGKLKIDKEAPLQVLEQNPDSFLQEYLRFSLQSLVKYKKLKKVYNNRIIKKADELSKKQQTDRHLAKLDVEEGGDTTVFGFDGWKTLQE